MLKPDLEKLILSLSSTEKKNFRAYCKQQSSGGQYVELFEIYQNCKPGAALPEEQFQKRYPGVSFDNTAAYLFKVLSDMLTLNRIQQDKWFGRIFEVMKAKLYAERSLSERSLKSLAKTQQQAEATEDHLLQYLCSRMELSHLAAAGFEGLDQQELVDRQMRGRKTLQVLRQTQEHHSLYELLSHKLLYQGNTLAARPDNSLDDLVLNELSIITRGSSQHFASRKLHLLFQSYFFIHKGDYNSGLKLFKELNALMESHGSLLDFPPYDYLDTLKGILNSLKGVGYHEEMQYFLLKMEELCKQKYPEHFLNLCGQTLRHFKMGVQDAMEAYVCMLEQYEVDAKASVFDELALSPEHYMEYLLMVAKASYHLGEAKRANTLLLKAFDVGRHQTGLPIFRTCRLFYLILQHSRGNIELLSYDIRAYKRAYHGKYAVLPFERCFFELILSDYKIKGFAQQKRFVEKLRSGIEKMATTAYQSRVLAYFDFVAWMEAQV